MGFQIILRRVFGIKKCLGSIKTLFRDTENRLRLHIKYVVWTREFKLNLDFWVASGDFSASAFNAWLKSHDSKFANSQILFPKPAVFTYHDGHSNFQEKLCRKFPEFRSRKRFFQFSIIDFYDDTLLFHIYQGQCSPILTHLFLAFWKDYLVFHVNLFYKKK